MLQKTKTLMLLSAALVLSACASGKRPMPEVIMAQAVPAPVSLTVKPAPLPQPQSGQLPELEANHREVAKAYHQLANRYCQLLAFLQERACDE